MAVHYFHCTDGVDLIVDRTGRDARGASDLRLRAEQTAREVMGAVPAYSDWEDWAVHIYDSRGEVEIVPFTSAGQA